MSALNYYAYYIEELEKKDKIWHFIIKWAVDKDAVIEIKHCLYQLDDLFNETAVKVFRKNFDINELIINETKYIENGNSTFGKSLKVFHTYSNINPPNRANHTIYLYPKLLLRFKSNTDLNSKLLKSKNFMTCEWKDNLKDVAFYDKIDSIKPFLLCNEGVIYLLLNNVELALFKSKNIKLFRCNKNEIDAIVLLDI